MNDLAKLCRELSKDMNLSQRALAVRLGVSLGRCEALTKEAVEKEYVSVLPGAYGITMKGREYLEQFRVQNAVILAADMDVRFVPFTHETPKCLMRVEGERMIHRLIRQLQARGITDITVVVGYLAEKFEHLRDRFGVKLLADPGYAGEGNFSAMYTARHLLGDTYVVKADQWMWVNVFDACEPDAWCACHWHEGPTDRWCLGTDGHRRITQVHRCGSDELALLGPVHLNPAVSKELVSRLEAAHGTPKAEGMYWEELLREHLEEVELYANILPQPMVQDFATLEELRDFDTSYMEESGNSNLQNIARIFGVPEGRISKLTWQDIGMTNQSFIFNVDGKPYMYRIPGEGTENFISRKTEAEVYKAIAPLNIADKVVYFDPETGIKIAEYYPNSHNVDEEDMEQVKTCMQILRRLHLAQVKVDNHFDILKKAEEFEAMCREVDCIHFADFAEVKGSIRPVMDIIRDTGEPQVLCHCDSANVNFLVLDDGSIRLLDWEYGGMCHPVADVAMFGVFSNYDFGRIEEMLAWYYDRQPTLEERILCFAYVAASGFLWSMWATFREYYGEDFGEYTANQWRIAKNGTTLVHELLAQRAKV